MHQNNTKYPNILSFEVTGRYGLFSDPLMRVGGEKCSYQVPTYEALKGIVSSIYWKPTLIWYIDKVRIMNPIQTEVKGIRPIRYHGGNDLSYYTYLKDCRYQIQAHFEWNLNRPELEKDRDEHKHYNIAKRMLDRGGRRDVFLGTRECQGYVEPCQFGEGQGRYDDTPELAFGVMFHGITYPDEAYSDETKDTMTARFWIPVMRRGVIEFPRPEKFSGNGSRDDFGLPLMCKKLRSMKAKVFDSSLGNFSPIDELLELKE